ncbi:MAG: zinc-ribbon domain-containing protein, partial [Desulfobacterales bacterium]|nr:zinc-ribbon domain-containing protein [Desulfobacterales bacterium]
MIITCDKCNTRFSLDDALIKATGTKVRCKQCEHVFDVYPSGKPASDDKGDAEISGLELESQ